MDALINRIPILKGYIEVTTKIRSLFFLNRPHTSVIPLGFSDWRLGFQVHYNTSDPDILAELHNFYVGCVAAGGFEVLLKAVKMGAVDFPDEQKHLAQYVTGFRY
jgi:hypothetical protein